MENQIQISQLIENFLTVETYENQLIKIRLSNYHQ